ncbi:CbtA family protein [Streptomyces hydrogenans]|uniref:CbtA family protein n=1 Tax=Streptomyces hydrogenans TaxID=1873719 RepID=UPI0037F894F1
MSCTRYLLDDIGTLSVPLGFAAVIAGRRPAPRLGSWNATLVAAAGFVVATGLAFVFLPANDDAVKPGFPAALLWEFRLASPAVQPVLWAVFGVLAQRLLGDRPGADAPTARTSASLV